MKHSTKLRKSDLPAALLAAFPNYSGRKFRLEVTESVTFYDLNASGGTWNRYTLVSLDGQGAAALPHESPFNPRVEGATFMLQPHFVVVEHSHFCGKDLGLRFHVHPSDVAKLLPIAGENDQG